ncbi:MAG: alpha-L-fucosidase [Acidobacteriota bacterium]
MLGRKLFLPPVLLSILWLMLLGLPSWDRPAVADEHSEFEPTWESIKKHRVPDWYQDAKLGIFIHWGLYSVPGWAPPTGELGQVAWSEWFANNPYAEWYLNTWRIPDSQTRQYHLKTYGGDFDYLDFVPQFNREIQKWNPEEWAGLFKKVGARYVVLTTKHHDGFTLWPSQVRNPHRKPDQQSAKRDLVGELTAAVRRQGLRMGLYYSGGLDWSFTSIPITSINDLRATTPQSDEYARYADAHWRELMERYRPAILWNDISYPKKGAVKEIFAEFYNRQPDGVINNRWGVDFADITTPEYAKYDHITPQKWESCRGIGFSFGFNRAEGPEHMLSVDKLVDLLVDIVSKNGNLLLNIGPMADGTIPAHQLERLKGLGAWLRVNGEAIFETRPWVRAEGKTIQGTPVRYTVKGDSAYAILLETPAGVDLTLESLFAADNTLIQNLGSSTKLAWSQKGRDLHIKLPAPLSDSPAHAFKITPRPWQLVRE